MGVSAAVGGTPRAALSILPGGDQGAGLALQGCRLHFPCEWSSEMVQHRTCRPPRPPLPLTCQCQGCLLAEPQTVHPNIRTPRHSTGPPTGPGLGVREGEGREGPHPPPQQCVPNPTCVPSSQAAVPAVALRPEAAILADPGQVPAAPKPRGRATPQQQRHLPSEQ